MKHGSEGIHSGFENQDKQNEKSKEGYQWTHKRDDVLQFYKTKY